MMNICPISVHVFFFAWVSNVNDFSCVDVVFVVISISAKTENSIQTLQKREFIWSMSLRIFFQYKDFVQLLCSNNQSNICWHSITVDFKTENIDHKCYDLNLMILKRSVNIRMAESENWTVKPNRKSKISSVRFSSQTKKHQTYEMDSTIKIDKVCI